MVLATPSNWEQAYALASFSPCSIYTLGNVHFFVIFISWYTTQIPFDPSFLDLPVSVPAVYFRTRGFFCFLHFVVYEALLTPLFLASRFRTNTLAAFRLRLWYVCLPPSFSWSHVNRPLAPRWCRFLRCRPFFFFKLCSGLLAFTWSLRVIFISRARAFFRPICIYFSPLAEQ